MLYWQGIWKAKCCRLCEVDLQATGEDSLKNNPGTPCVLLKENPFLNPKFAQEYKLLDM